MHNPLGSGFFILNNRDIGKIKGSLDRLFEKKGGGDVKGGVGDVLEENFHPEGCIYEVLPDIPELSAIAPITIY